MPITNLALADPFAALSITGQPPPNVLFNFNPVHIVHRDPRSIATQGPPSVQQLTLEQLAESTYTINLPLNTSSIRKILQGRRKFISEMEGMINDLPHITELTVVVGIEPIHTDLTNARETVTDLFWTTVNAALFCRNSLIKYTASMENTHYIANNGDEVRALLEDLTFMVV
ncbi:tRNA (adenine(58)-N(1))-methyltransferase catalytic subunit [Venturia inaequalis]|nr:tRNA (adenine(58)-N(1))-methyltransferase catalytic subunit [Venturia inaequalis]